MKNFINIMKENKNISVTFIVLLLISSMFGFGIFLMTGLIEVGFLTKWTLAKNNNNEEIKRFSKRERKLFIGLMVSLFFILCFATDNSVELELEETQAQIEEKQQENNNLRHKYNVLLGENKELKEKVEEAEPWFEMKEEERIAEEKRLEEERLAREEAERKEKEEQERKEKEEQERLERERLEKEKQGYNTGITYSQLARTPDKYEGEKVKFSGKVLQIQEGLFSDVIRLAVNGSYDNVLWLTVPSGITEERILEDDQITIYGVSEGIHTYTTVMGASMSIPSVSVDRIDN